MPRFQDPKRAQIEEEWKKLTSRTFTDAELETFDDKLQKNFNGLHKRSDIEDLYVKAGAARWGYGPNSHVLIFLFDSQNTGNLAVERVDNKIKQWQDWRRKKFPTARLRDYGRMAGQIARSKQVINDGDIHPLEGEFAA